MANTKFSQFSAYSPSGGSLMGVGLQGGTNVQFPVRVIANVTLSHTAPTDLDPALADTFHLTSDGSGQVQVANLLNFPVDGDGYDVPMIGKIIEIVLVDQANGSDAVHVTVQNTAPITCKGIPGVGSLPLADYALLDYLNASAEFQWGGSQFSLDLTIYNNDTVMLPGSGQASIIPTQDFNNIRATNIPTADPHIAGVIWANLGILTISAG